MKTKNQNWEIVTVKCVICGAEFEGKKHQIYCSKKCNDIALQHIAAYNRKKQIREKKFANLVRYVKEYNLREILKKYLPGKAA